MKIATWNVAYARGETSNERRRAVLKRIDADVWVLTETHIDLTPGSGYRPIHSCERNAPGNRSVVADSRWVTIWARDELMPRPIHVTDPERTAACSLETESGPFWVFGTVLPWYGDREKGSVAVEVARQQRDWLRMKDEVGPVGCVAGDFNVNLGGGPHYYGSRESKSAVKASLCETGLFVLTDYPNAKLPGRDYGLIDHIAVSQELSVPRPAPCVWDKTDEDDHLLSDHAGVAVDIAVDL